MLARDRVGILPLHWTEHRGQLWFASEVKALFAGNPELPRALDPEGLQDALTFWAPLAPRTAFRGVRQIPPGHVRRVRGNSVRERAYWQPAFPRRGAPELANKRVEDSAREVRSALERATALRTLRADVPVGSYLSGGLDSSMVAALGATARGAPLATFSLRFHDAEYDETPYQRQMAAALGGEHREIHIGRRDIARVFPDVVLHAERPLLRTAPAPLFLLSRLVRASGIKVDLADLFREARVRRFWSRQPGSSARPALLQRLYPYLARSPVSRPAAARAFFGQDLGDAHTRGFGHGPRWRSAAALQRLLSPSLRDLLAARDPVAEFVATLPPQFDAWEPLAQDQTVEMRTLLSDYLLSAQGDRMLMAHSVEGRFPFLDPDVIDLAARLPSRHKLLGLQEKHVLKRAARGLVPAAIIERTKQPFRAPDALCFVEQGSPDWIGEVISERALHDAGVFDPAAVGSLTRKCRANANTAQLSNADNMALVTVLSTQLLHEALVRKAPDIAPPRRFPLIDRLEGMSHG